MRDTNNAEISESGTPVTNQLKIYNKQGGQRNNAIGQFVPIKHKVHGKYITSL